MSELQRDEIVTFFGIHRTLLSLHVFRTYPYLKLTHAIVMCLHMQMQWRFMSIISGYFQVSLFIFQPVETVIEES